MNTNKQATAAVPMGHFDMDVSGVEPLAMTFDDVLINCLLRSSHADPTCILTW